ncbi:MAG: polysaccharide deacetylase family protein [bacterium]|nr:polysaccharide deacetylase family protein [bacterium]
MNRIRTAFVIAVVVVAAGLFFSQRDGKGLISPLGGGQPVASPTPTPSPSPTPKPTPTPIPLPDPKVYGPCKNIPVLLYHHVQPQEDAKANGQVSISMSNEIFATQMAYLKERGYRTLTPRELLDGLVSNSLSGRIVLLTFDDGYEDFYKYAYPELVKNSLRATVFVSTGLMGNPGYLSWGQISEMKGSGLITFGNHTWSHKNLGAASEEGIRYEVATAKTQLEEHGLGPVDLFAYPYGGETKKVQKMLEDLGIKIAFTTIPGPYQCAKLPLDFRRSRVGNSPLSAYGL